MLLFSEHPEDESKLYANKEIVHARGDYTKWKTYVTWHENHLEHKTPEAETEIDQVYNDLMENQLKSFDTMISYCHDHPGAKIKLWCEAYEFFASGTKCDYILRCLCIKGDYNFYLFCYGK